MPQVAIKKINRSNFYKLVRNFFFNGRISQSQVDGIEVILNEWEKKGYNDRRWLSYMLGTIYHECAGTFRPIEEYGRGKGYKYGKPEANGKIYFGRGFVQLTHGYNYKTMGDILGIDLYNYPDAALDCTVATDILFEGMINGRFTGKKLSDYFNGKKEDWLGARRIINGQDKASLIAGYSKKFYTALV